MESYSLSYYVYENWKTFFLSYGFTRDCPLVVSDLRSETKGSSPDASYVQRWALCSNRPANV